MALIYNVSGRYKKGAECARRAVAINPRSEVATRSLFNALFELGDFDEAYGVIKNYAHLTGSDAFSDLLEGFESLEDYEELRRELAARKKTRIGERKSTDQAT